MVNVLKDGRNAASAAGVVACWYHRSRSGESRELSGERSGRRRRGGSVLNEMEMDVHSVRFTCLRGHIIG